MGGHERLSALLICCVLWLVAAGIPVHAQIHYESFDTNDFKDPVNTTADWNTTEGVLKLFPFTYSLLGSYDTPGNAKGVRAVDFRAIVADGGAGLHLINVFDPANPSLDDTYDTPGAAEDVFVLGSYAYVADGSSGLQIIRMSSYSTLSLAGSIDPGGTSLGVFVSGHHAYLASYFSGLQVIDVSDPTAPSLAGVYNTSGTAYDVFVSGDYAFVADGNAGLKIVDISNPASPSLAATLPTASTALGIEVSGDRAYLAVHGSGLQVIDVSDPTAPSSVGILDTPGYAWGISIAGNFAYIADANSGIQVIDITDPALPVLVGSYDTTGSAYGITVEGNCAYVGDYAAGLKVIDISDPCYLDEVGLASTPYSSFDLDISGNHAYMVNGSGGLQVIDISDPTDSQVVGSFSNGDWATDVSVSGNYAYVAVFGGDNQVVDISDPTSPTLAALGPTGDARAIDVSGNYAYVDDLWVGLRVIDITTPTAPVEVGSLSLSGGVIDIQVVGKSAFVLDGASVLHVVDVSDPTSPSAGSSYDTQGSARSVHVWGRYTFIADEVQGLIMLDNLAPSHSWFLDSLQTPGNANGVFVSGDRIYVADWDSGLQVIEINDLGYLEIVGEEDSGNKDESVIVKGDYAYIAYAGGLRVVQVQQRNWDMDNNKAQSLVFDDSDYGVACVSIECPGLAAIDLEFSANNGGFWQPVTTQYDWVQLLAAGSDLLWRTAHRPTPGDGAISFLDVRYRYVCGPVSAVEDIPDDQGGWVRVIFDHSGYDVANAAPLAATGYWVHQRVDDPALVARVLEGGKAADATSGPNVDQELAALGDVLFLDDRTFITNRDKADDFPPGVWEVVGSVPAMQLESYSVRVPTLADSTGADPAQSTFVVTTHTTEPTAWFICDPDSGSSVDNIAPGVPQNLAADYQAGGVTLDWDDAPEADFQYFRIYRSSDPGFVPGPGSLVQETEISAWTDATADPWGLYYKVTALDHAGNESETGSPETVSGVSGENLPLRTALLGAAPNPFNPSTKLSFETSRAGHARLKVFDAAGRLVRTLVDGHREAGQFAEVWDGRDDRGRMSAAGVYLYRFEFGTFVDTKRIVLVK